MGLAKNTSRAAARAALLAFAALCALAAGCAGSRAPDAAGFDTPPPKGALLDADGAPLSEARLTGLLAGADYVLMGEGHANACDHAAQAHILQQALEAGISPVVGLEMLPAKAQPRLDAANRGEVKKEALEAHLDWEANWGYDYAMYAPVLELALDGGAPLFALNADKRLVKKAGRAGLESLRPSERARLPGELVPPPAAQEAFLKERFEEHKKLLAGMPGKDGKTKAPSFSDKRLHSFFTIQSLWDTQMAQRAFLARALYGRPVFVLAGAGHVERGWGAAHRLKAFDPDARVLSILPWRGGEAPAPGEADLYYFCPVVMKSRLGLTLELQAQGPGADPVPVITATAPGSRAEAAGLLPGDVISRAGGAPVSAMIDLHKAAIAAGRSRQPLVFEVLRNGESVAVSIDLGERQAK